MLIRKNIKVIMMPKGKVYWITGLSGAGKTTVGRLLYKNLLINNDNVIFLDGDTLREVFGNDLGYSVEDRHISAMRNARLCNFLSDQGMIVICCTISMFHDVRKWNRDNIDNYIEIYLKVSLDVLKKRNQKNLYKKSRKDVVGIGIDMEEPVNADIVINNDGEFTPDEILKMIERL